MNRDEVFEPQASGSGVASERDKRDSMSLIESSFPPYQENAESPQETRRRFPISVLFIVGSEFCERFSFYGLQAVLAIYLNTALGMTTINSIVVFHTFVMASYFTPLLGSILADEYLGKFRTIYYVSIMYSLGSLILAAFSIPHLSSPMFTMSMVALVLIALGTGGIKPCVSAFGGDQFDNDQAKQRDRFFFMYYFAINAGSLISMFITPILKADVSCFGQETCYPLAFTVPAVLMVISVGHNSPKKEENVSLVDDTFYESAMRNFRRNGEHWLDNADDRFRTPFLSDIKAVLRVWFLYVPLPVFWALFGLQGSLWTFQAQELDGRLSSSYTIIPEQMQVVNPMLILMLIPVFNFVIYPHLAKYNILTRPLKRMLVGGLLAAAASLFASIVQLEIEANLPSYPAVDHTDVVFINNGPCVLQLQSLSSTTTEVTSRSLNITLDDKMFFSEHINVLVGQMEFLHVRVSPAEGHPCKAIPGPNYPVFNVDIRGGSAHTAVFFANDNDVNMIQGRQLREKPINSATIRLAYNLAVGGNQLMLMKKDSKINCTFSIGNLNIGITTHGGYGTDDGYCNTEPGTYILYLPNGSDHLFDTGIEIHLQNGGQYIYSIYASGSSNEKVSVKYYVEVAENDISMLWQIPQYLLITCAEIMISITGFQFSYSQAPASMRSVLQASFLLTIAFGNVIIIIISGVNIFSRYSHQYIVYATIMALVMVLFSFMCKNYVYVTIDNEGNVVYPKKEEDEQERTQRTAEPNPDEPPATLQ